MSERDDSLDAVIADYLQQVEAGRVPDREVLLAQHPEHAEALRAFFADCDRLDRQAADLRLSADPNRTTDDEPPPDADATGLAGLPRVRYFGDYELLEVIARGGMGVVYKARQVSLNRVVALKMILKGELATPRDVERFHAEAEAAANLDHPHIVPIYEVGEHDGQQYYAMRYVEGASLNRHPRADARMEARMTATIARAVYHAHQHGILHRDIKPSNILVDSGGTPFVTDFGLAKRVDSDRTFTESGALVGTPRYMAPEQAAGRKDLTVAADVYSLGVVLYERLTGRPPFDAEAVLEILRQVREMEPARPSSIIPGINRDLETICLKCLEKDPPKRYGSAEALADDLERWQRGEPIRAKQSSTWQRAVKWAKRRPAVTALLAVSGVGLLSIGVLAGILWHEAEKRFEAERHQAETERDKNERLQEQNKVILDREGRARRYLYAAHLNLAQQALDIGHAARVIELLRLHQPQNDEEDLRGFEWYHLWKQCHRDRLTLRGIPPDAVISAAGKFVATPVADGAVRLFRLPSGEEYAVLRGHRSRVQCLTFSPDGRTLATAGTDGTVKLWDLGQAHERGTLQGETKAVNVIQFSPNGKTLVTGAERGAVILWDVEKREPLTTFKGHAAGVRSALFAPGGKTLATRDAQGTVKLWNASTGAHIASLKAPKGMVSCEAISPDGSTLATGTVTVDMPLANLFYNFDLKIHRIAPSPNTIGEVILWEVTTGRKIVVLGGHEGMVTSVGFAQDGKTLVSTSAASKHIPMWEDRPQMSDRPGQLKLWDLAERRERALKMHPRGLWSIAHSPDGKVLAGVAGAFGEIDIWDARSGKPRAVLTGHTAAVTQVEFLSDGKTLVSVGDDSTMRLWDVEVPEEPHVVYDRGLDQGNTVFLPDGNTIVTARQSPGVKRWDTRTGKELGLLSVWSMGPVSLAPDRKTLATASLVIGTALEVKLWDTASLRQRRTLKSALPSLTRHQHALAFSPQGDLLATAGWDEWVLLWDTTTGKYFSTRGASPGIQSVAFAPDGKTFATGGKDGTVKLWDTNSWQERASWSAHADEVWALVFSPDGKILASGCGKPVLGHTPCEAKLWDAASGSTLVASLEGHLGTITAVAFSPDGKRLATASEDRTVKLWDVVSGQCALTLMGHGHAVDGVDFSTDGKMLATTSRDGTIRIWHAASDDEVKTRGE